MSKYNGMWVFVFECIRSEIQIMVAVHLARSTSSGPSLQFRNFGLLPPTSFRHRQAQNTLVTVLPEFQHNTSCFDKDIPHLHPPCCSPPGSLKIASELPFFWLKFHILHVNRMLKRLHLRFDLERSEIWRDILPTSIL